MAEDNSNRGAVRLAGGTVMRRLRGLLLRLAGLLGMRRRDTELAEELESHLDMHMQDNMRAGMDAAEARRQAFIKLGGTTQTREHYWKQNTLPVIEDFFQDVRYGARGLLKRPGFTVLAVLTLALGIGANTAIFSVVNTVILRPLPYANPDRLVMLNETANTRGRLEILSVSWPTYLDWKAQAQSFQYLGVFRFQNLTLTSSDHTERLHGAMASADVFNALGLRPILGRTFTAAEDEAGAPAVAILSERLWRNTFAASTDIINRTITLDGMSYTVVGVMPAVLRFPSPITDIWVSLGPYVNSMPSSRDNHPGLTALGLLKANVALQTARLEMETFAQRLAQQYPDTNSFVNVRIITLYDSIVSNIRGSLLVLLGAVVFVLLIACVNLANMTLARGEGRLRELAVRNALGASRGRLLRQLLAESLLLAFTGGSLGIAWAWVALKLLVASQPSSIPRIDSIGIDLTVLGFTFLVSLVVAVLFGLSPALRVTSPKAHACIRQASPALSARSRLTPFLVVAEVGLAMVLLVGAMLMTRTFSALTRVSLGFHPEHVITMQVSLPSGKYSATQWATFYGNLLDRVKGLPGVQAEGISSLTPLVGGGRESGILPEPLPKDPNQRGPGCTFAATSRGYFEAMGIQLIRGRTFAENDSADRPPVIVVDEATVQTFWPGQDPIGRRVAFEFRGQSIKDPQPMWREVVGVVRTVRYYDLTTPNTRLQVYVPYGQPPFWFSTLPPMTLMIRTQINPEGLVNAVRHEVASLDPALPVFAVSTMTEYVDGVLAQPRMSMALMAGFAGLALAMALIGIYGVLSYSVSQRTQEIGIRMALGASRGHILQIIMKQGVTLTLAGVAVGIIAALASTRLIQGLLYGVSSTDTATYLSVPGVLLAAALAATFIPARRATKVDPLNALRHE
jgi:putative ABC transport system permease protein